MDRTRQSFGLVVQILSGVGAAARVSVAGYFAGGLASGTYYSTIDKIAFPSDTKSTISAVTTQSQASSMAMADSGVAGYIGAGGNISGHDFSITKISFATTEVASFLTATLTSQAAALNSGGCFANSGVAGYFVMGSVSGVEITNVNKLAFPAETISTVSPTFATARAQHGACADIGVAGYVGGGSTGGGSTLINTFQKITFPSDTIAAVTATLTQAANEISSMADSGVAGYWCGGAITAPDRLSRIDKLSFPSETKSTLSATLTTQKSNTAAMADSGVAGYITGGFDGTNHSSVIDRIAFPADTKTTLGGTLTNAKSQLTAFANCGVF